jgi:Lrp/AsnC family leucine-responsive transcriptional regulator
VIKNDRSAAFKKGAVMDAVDQAILGSLERDGRQSYAALAESVGLSKTPCWMRVQALENSGAIRGFHADIDPRALGLGVHAFVQVMIDFTKRAEFETAVLANTSILECYTTAGDADYVLKIICRDVDDLDELLRFNLSLLPGLQRSTTIVCLKAVKHGTSITQVNSARPAKQR